MKRVAKELGEKLTDEELQARERERGVALIGAKPSTDEREEVHLFVCNAAESNIIIAGFTPSMFNIPLVIIIIFFLQEMIDEADKDGDGEVNETEFLRIMKKTNMY